MIPRLGVGDTVLSWFVFFLQGHLFSHLSKYTYQLCLLFCFFLCKPTTNMHSNKSFYGITILRKSDQIKNNNTISLLSVLTCGKCVVLKRSQFKTAFICQSILSGAVLVGLFWYFFILGLLHKVFIYYFIAFVLYKIYFGHIYFTLLYYPQGQTLLKHI